MDEAQEPTIRRLAPALLSAATNAGLRALTLVSKFLLVVAMARFLVPSEVGVYGLMASAVAFTVFAVGLEYHYYSLRAVISAPAGERPAILRDQIVLHTLTALVALPLLAVLFSLFAWTPVPIGLMGWFYALAFIELATTEAGIALVGLSKPVAANLMLFVRSGIWVYVLVLLFSIDPGTRNVGAVFLAWALGAVGSLVIVAFHMRGLGWRSALMRGVDWHDLLRGIRVAVPFIVTTGASLGLLFFDRFVLEFFQGLTLLGVYVFFGSIATALHTLVNSGVSLVRMPRLVSTYRARDLAGFRRELRVMAQLTVAGVLVLVTLLALGIVPTVAIVARDLYGQHLNVFYALLFAAAMRCLADIPLYALYAQHHDLSLLGANSAAFGVSAVMNLVLVPNVGLIGAAIAAALGALTLVAVAFALASRAQRDLFGVNWRWSRGGE